MTNPPLPAPVPLALVRSGSTLTLTLPSEEIAQWLESLLTPLLPPLSASVPSTPPPPPGPARSTRLADGKLAQRERELSTQRESRALIESRKERLRTGLMPWRVGPR